MNLEVRSRAARPCLEGSKSRNRLSGTPTRPVVFLGGGMVRVERTRPMGDRMFTRHFATLARVLLLAVLGGWLLHPSIALAQTSDSAPVGRVDSLSFVAVSAGGWHTCAVPRDGVAYCWGFGRHGELGTGDTTSSPVPVQVAGGYRFVAVTAGLNHACGVTVGGIVYCWGLNKDNQLGNDSLERSKSPVAIAGEVMFRSVMAGGQHTCAIAADTTAYCWGDFEHGRLGVGAS